MQTRRVFKLDMATSRWIDAKHIMKDKSLFLSPRGSMSVEAKEQGYRVYTAGEESFGMLDLRSGEGRICCDHDDECKMNNFWVMPELLFRDRDPKWWAALYNMNDQLLDRVYAVLFVLLLLSSFSLPLIFCVVILYLMVMFWAPWTSLCNENE
ncbi:uncharacterized protein A4U43_C02F3510 [Asparagus officinalis]|uniref:Uncharacterized protein n=1 Tax=Asparagus officinalis TaxID=4686 RepID=A0A5P1FKM3_ASPOF|nr:uncharacterized protein A4U43_C02F3510 [Asparagus officinalis]